MTCTGMQLEVLSFPYVGCTPAPHPVNYAFASWDKWSSPTCALLCERSRIIAVMNNEAGMACGAC